MTTFLVIIGCLILNLVAGYFFGKWNLKIWKSGGIWWSPTEGMIERIKPGKKWLFFLLWPVMMTDGWFHDDKDLDSRAYLRKMIGLGPMPKIIFNSIVIVVIGMVWVVQKFQKAFYSECLQ